MIKKRIQRRQRTLLPRNPDAAVLDQLRRLGGDLSRERLIHYYLYFPSKQNAERARDELLRAGFSVECQRSAADSTWLCLAMKRMLPQLVDLNAKRMTFEQLATRLGGEFDGWETQVSAGEIGSG